jgi:hypothetical protein
MATGTVKSLGDQRGHGFITPNEGDRACSFEADRFPLSSDSAVHVISGKPHDQGGEVMASSGKRKTTFAKLARESRLRERRLEKQARKDARKQASENQPTQPTGVPSAEDR